MMELEQMEEMLKKRLEEKRYIHSLGVMEMAVKLAKRYDADVEKAQIAGLLHDIAKNMSEDEYIKKAEEYGISLDEIRMQSPKLLHGLIGAKIAKNELGIYDEEILHAIEVHTTGCLNMSLLDKIIYIADYIEMNRTEEQVPGLEDLRKLAFEDIDKAVVVGIDIVLKYLISKGRYIFLDTIAQRNKLLKDIGGNSIGNTEIIEVNK